MNQGPFGRGLEKVLKSACDVLVMLQDKLLRKCLIIVRESLKDEKGALLSFPSVVLLLEEVGATFCQQFELRSTDLSVVVVLLGSCGQVPCPEILSV